MSMFGSSLFGFGGMSMLFGVVFVVVIGCFLVVMIRGILQWRHNNAQPVLSVFASVVAKRLDVSHHHHHDPGNHMNHMTTSTNYYVTFEVDSGDRMEFSVHNREYGMLAEGDAGTLTFQGTRYLGFQRTQ